MAEPVYPAVIHFALGTFKALGLKLDVRGIEHVPATGGGVVAINHIGYLDFALAGVPFWYGHRRLIRFMAKDQVFRHPVSGPLMRGMKHIPVDRAAGAGAYRAALTALRGGELIGVFPEATISQSYCLKEFKTGAVRMAVSASVPIYPLVLWGSQRVWTKGRQRDLRAARGTPVTITLGAPLHLPAGTDAVAGSVALAAAMENLLAAAQRDYPTDPAGASWWLPARAGGGAPTPERAAELEREQAGEKLRRSG